jgi:hypothetical protein
LISSHSTDLFKEEGVGPDEVLLLRPDVEGTTVQSASELSDVKVLLEGGLSLAEALVPETRPKDVWQLALFGDA